MNGELNDFVQYLKKEITEEIRETYGKVALERWDNLRYMGPMDHPDGYALLRGKCGDVMVINLRFVNGRVHEASFQTEGCGASAVCGSFAAELALGKTPEELLEISSDQILEVLGGLPREEEHLASLAAETLHAALTHYVRKKQEGNK